MNNDPQGDVSGGWIPIGETLWLHVPADWSVSDVARLVLKASLCG